jgi:enamine deaminase RidA (YjgF/YER057c/UK114 family)
MNLSGSAKIILCWTLKGNKMEHTRIRTFNTKETYPEQNLDNDLCQAVVAKGATVFLRGQVSQDLDSRESLHMGDAGLQTRKAMQNIEMLLHEAGSSMSHICRVVVYLTDIRYREDVYREMGAWLKGVYPCSTGLVIDALARPEWLVEIEATAVIPDDTGAP